MDKDRAFSLLRSWALAFMLSFGSVLCLATGFSLTQTQAGFLAAFCGGVSLLFSLALLFPRGGIFLACLGAVAAGYLWRLQKPWQQLLWLVQHISEAYHSAYGWGFLQLTDGVPGSRYGLSILGAGISFAISHSVCRGRPVWLSLAAALLPLLLCLGTPNATPHPMALLLLLSGAGVLLLSGQVRQQSPRQGNRLAVMAAVPVTAALGLLLWLNPHESYVNHSAEAREHFLSVADVLPGAKDAMLSLLQQAASPETVALSALGPRQQVSGQIMTVTAQQSGSLYLRERDYDRYDGKTWTSGQQRTERFALTAGSQDTVTIRTQGVHRRLYLPYYPSGEISLTGGALANQELVQEYTVTRTVLQHPQVTDFFPVPPELSAYLELPGDTRQQAAALLEDFVPENGSASQLALAVGDYLRREGEYDLSPAVMPSGEADFSLWFLENGKTGYCVHFATAAVVLLRSAGVPARYVTGYLVETEAGKEVAVTGEDAHAWAEFYEPGLGLWLILEATPPGQQPLPENTEALGSQATLPEPAEAEEPERSSLSPQSTALWGAMLPVCLLAVLAAEVQRRLRLALSTRHQRRGSRNRQALARFQEAERLSRLLDCSPTPELMALAQKAKFSPHSLTEEELEPFDSYLRECRAQLKQKSVHLRLVHRYLYAVY